MTVREENRKTTFLTFIFFCNLYIFKEKQRQIQIQKKHMTGIYNFTQIKSFNLSKENFCSNALKFQTPRTVSNGNHFLYICTCIYYFCVDDKKF